MKIIGITGSSGSGKTSICELIAKNYNAKVIDADVVVKELQDSKSEYYKKIVETFGKGILLENNLINRKRLADIIFSNSSEKEKLDKLTFKYVVDEINTRIENFKKEKLDYIIVDAPTLIEANMTDIFDKIIVVTAKEQNKIDRVCKRDGISNELAKKRLASQKEDAFYERYADFVISNDDENLKNKVGEILEKIGR